MWGSAGTGKTLILMEALKIKLSKLLRLGKRVRILATTYDDNQTELQKKYAEKHLVNMRNVEVMDLKKLCHDLNIECRWEAPLETVHRVTRSLSDSSDKDVTTLLSIDKVFPCGPEQPTPDWRDLVVRENVIWLLALSPNAERGFSSSPNSYSASSTEVLPPEDSSVLTWHLKH